MDSFELEIDERSRIGAEFMERVSSEIRRAFAEEKAARKITQQAVAEKIGTSRAVVNRQVQGFENLTSRRIAELLWAIGWEPHFEARKPLEGANDIGIETVVRLDQASGPKTTTTGETIAIAAALFKVAHYRSLT